MWLDCSDHLSLLLQVCTVTVGMVRWRRGKKKKVFSLSLEIPPLAGCKLSVSLRARNPWNTQVILVVEHSIPHDIPGFYDFVQTLFSVKKWIALNLILVHLNRDAMGVNISVSTLADNHCVNLVTIQLWLLFSSIFIWMHMAEVVELGCPSSQLD